MHMALADQSLSAKALRARLDAPPKVDLIEHMRIALAAQDDRGIDILSEIELLRRGPGSLTAEEYFYYRLYDPHLTLAEKQRFAGKRAQARLHAECNDSAWDAVAHDKLQFHATMVERGFPVPPLLALYHPERALAGVPTLTTPAALADFLRRRAAYPCFAKPVDGMYSLGAFSVAAYERVGDSLAFSNGERIGVDSFVRAIAETDYDGYMIQARLRSHPDLAYVIGDRVATIRLLVLLTERRAEIFRALCKIPVGANIADNFWRPGNMLGAIDLASGRIIRVVSGVGKDQELHGHHPDTERQLVGSMIPMWEETTALCLEAASTLTGIRTQSWDIAVTPRGPVLVEVNSGGDLNLPQLAFGAGVLDDRFKAHVEACAYARKA